MMTEIRTVGDERVIVTERGDRRLIFPLPPDADEKMVARLLAAAIREERQELLTGCDYILMSDYPASDEAKERWRVYRKALRDLLKQPGYPMNVTWPEAPT